MKLNLFLVLTIALLFVSSSIFGQQRSRPGSGERGEGQKPQITIKGTIVDSSSDSPLEYATISIFQLKDSLLVAGGTSDEKGIYEVMSPVGRLFAVIEYLGYQSQIINPIPIDRDQLRAGNRIVDLGSVSLSVDGETLDEVEVVSERSETQFSLDKRVFNVGKDLANRGGTAEDILDNVPSVTVDIEGTVELRGNAGVRILVNGRPSGLAGLSGSTGLKNIPANMIEAVEVITNPSARYEAEGTAGIINIVLKKEKRGGFNGSFETSVGIPESYGLGANLNYRAGDVNWFLNYGYRKRTGPGGGYRNQFNALTGDVISLQDRDQNRNSSSNSIRFGIDYFIGKNENLTGAFSFRNSDEDNLSTLNYRDFNQTGDGSLMSTTIRIDDEKEDDNNIEYSLNYRKQYSTREHVLNISAQYSDDSETESSLFDETINNASTSEVDLINQRSQNEEGEKRWLFQADFGKPLEGEDHKMEFGIRASLRDISNTYQVEELSEGGPWFEISEFTNDFQYNEDILAGYSTYGNRYNKFSYQAGLRVEYSDIKTELLQTNEKNFRSYTSLFPSLHLNYDLPNQNAIQVSYSRRVRRPRFRSLNPFFTFSDSRNTYSGNPNLDPEFASSYEVGHIKYWDKGTLGSSIYHTHITDKIERVLTLGEENGVITSVRRPENLAIQNNTGLDMTFSYDAVKWLRLSGNLNVYYSTTDGGAQYPELDAETFTWFGRATSRITFWKGSDLQIRFNYRGARETTQGRSKGAGSVDVGWTKDFLASKNATATLSVRDLFNSRVRRGETIIDDILTDEEFQWRARSTVLTFSYRINQKKQRRRGNRGGGQDFEGGEEF